VIVEQLERRHWRIWNGKASNPQSAIDRLREVMPAFEEESDHCKVRAPSGKRWQARHESDKSLTGQSAWRVHDANVPVRAPELDHR